MTAAPHRESRVLLSLTALLVTAPLFFLLLPLYVGALAEHASMSSAQVGSLVSVELAGAMATSALGVAWIRRWRWGRLAAGSLVVLIAANAASAAVVAFLPLLLAMRLLAGAATGVGVSIALAGLGDTANPARSYGIAVSGQLLIAGVALVLLPPWIGRFGPGAVFATFAGAASVSLALLRWLPEGGAAVPRSAVSGPSRSWLPFWGLAGSCSIFLAQTAVWAFTERIGAARGLTPGFIGFALGLAHVPAVAGALLATVVGKRVSPTSVMVACAFGEVIAASLLATPFSGMTFLIAACAYQFCWTLWVPLQMGMVAEADVGGRYTVLLTAAQAAGVSIGPAFAGRMIHGTVFTPVVVIGCVFALLGLALFWPLLVRAGTASKAAYPG